MKKSLYLGLVLFLLTACTSGGAKTSSSQEASGELPKALFETYGDLLVAFEDGLDGKSITGKPINPSSLTMFKQYAGEAGEVSYTHANLDHAGDMELLIGTKVTTGDKSGTTIYVAAYGEIDGKVQDLLAPVLVEGEDHYLVFYQNNRLRLDTTTPEGSLATGIYELTADGYKELLYLKTVEKEDGTVMLVDRADKTYSNDEKEGLLEAALGHGLDEAVIP